MIAKTFEIRNSTSKFLIFKIEGKDDGVQIVYLDDTIWRVQKVMAQLSDVGVPAISKHLIIIFETRELVADSVISKIETTTTLGY